MNYGTTRKVFISYHHRGDQRWFDEFTRMFADHYEIFHDNSLDGRIRSDDPEYINRAIREEHIVGSSITIALCGAATWKRKYVDWEIHSTLHHEHALLGIALPTATRGDQGKIVVPSRLHDNIQSDYAHWLGSWATDPQALKAAMELAIQKSQDTGKIRNEREKMGRNLS
ncbi:MAG: TIR domain-containing protein [Deltaproteobacteria bacterium]|nr:TIR domain-containing protein [Deltaproteobacteria bacterium]